MSLIQVGQGLLPIVNPLEFARGLAEKRKRSVEKHRARAQSGVLSKLRQQLLNIAHQLDLFEDSHREIVLDIAINWSDKELIALCDGLVSNALEDLRDAKNHLRRKEIFQWMAPSAPQDVPFSFNACCKAAGLDADNLRRFVLSNYREEIRRYVEEDDAAAAETTRQGALVLA